MYSDAVVFAIDPLRDPRWHSIIDQHPRATAFHTRGWLAALKAAHGYEPIAFTTSRPTEPLTNAVLFCIVRSWLTGTRLISLPFSDHCEPLVEHPEELSTVCAHLERLRKNERWTHVEMRSADVGLPFDGVFQRANAFYLHKLGLGPDLDALYKNFQKDCIRRKIQRAEREKLTYEVGNSEALLRKLYPLLEMTRLRHQVPPQPITWFHTLVETMGNAVCIRIASKGDRPVAGLLTLSHGKTVIYKYGGSDVQFNNLGGMPMLLWRTIQEAKRAGAQELDFGRSDCDSAGLIAFKEHWSAERIALSYWHCPQTPNSILTKNWKIRCARQLFAYLPRGVMNMAGNLLYRHMG